MNSYGSDDDFEKKSFERKKSKKRLKKKRKTKDQQHRNKPVISNPAAATPSSERFAPTASSSSRIQSASLPAPKPPVPNQIQSPRDLYWHKKLLLGNEPQYFPCYILSGLYKGIDSSDESDSDEEEEVQITYLSYNVRGQTPSTHTIMPKRLEPFHGKRVNQYDHDDIGKKDWCQEYMKKYLCNKKSQHFDRMKEEEYLMHVMEEARERGGHGTVGDDVLVVERKQDGHVGFESDDLEEPYTQAMSNSDSDDDLMIKRKVKKCEPIRPGDVIEYYSPMFVFGNKQGHRVATVMAVNPKRDTILKLSNNECIPDDTKVRRIKTLEKIEGRLALIEHPGIFRRIVNFNLKKLNMPVGYNIEREGDRLRNIVHKNLSKFKKKMKKSGFAPMDMMHKWGEAPHHDSDSDNDGSGDIDSRKSDHNESDSDGDSSEPLFRDSSEWKKERQRQVKYALQRIDNSSLDDSSLARISTESDKSYTRLRKKGSTKKVSSLRDTPESDGDKKSLIPASEKRAFLVDSDVDSDDSNIQEARNAVREKERELAILGLSDDEIPQAVFSTGKKQQQQQQQNKTTTGKSPRMWKNRVEKNKEQHRRKREDQYDSDSSMSFQSSGKNEKVQLQKQDILALDDSSSSDSDTKRRKPIFEQRSRKRLDDFSSDSDSDSMPPVRKNGAGIAVGRSQQGSRTPNRIWVSQKEQRSSKNSKKQSSQKKIESCLSISFRKYN